MERRSSGACLDENQLVAFADGTLSPEAAARADEHIDACADCALMLGALVRLDRPSSLGTDDRAVTDTELDDPLLRGATLGRYHVLELMGVGAMGRVYAAYDRELNRRVALKLLRLDRRGSEAATRLQVEAQAMARLSHPNVVSIFDVGTVDDELFIAMEFVDGCTLSEWMTAERRAWRDVLRIFRQAGSGLAAAHRAGIIHRDFKPDNVLIDRDGRALVADFGLACRAEDEQGTTSVALAGESASHTLAATRTGTVLGTPAYMAPEQRKGEPVDARADQYAFCVALHEGLYGRRPGSTDEDEPSSGERPSRRVPIWLRRVIARGLSVEPAHRFSSMDELLAALGRDPARIQLRLAGAAVVLALVACALVLSHRAPTAVCKGASDRLLGHWDETQRRAVERAFVATGQPSARMVWPRVVAILDAYAHDWTTMATEACEATQVRGEQSPQLLDLRMSCLSTRLDELSALGKVLETADASLVERAVSAAIALTPLSGCADSRALLAPLPPPRDPTLRAQVDAVRTQIAEAKALENAGRYPAAIERVQKAVEAAAPLGYPAVEAEAVLQLANLESLSQHGAAAEAAVYRAIAAADVGHHDEVRARAWSLLIYVIGSMEHRVAEAERLMPLAAAATDRTGPRPELEAVWLNRQLAMAMAREQYDAARVFAERALAILRRDAPKAFAAQRTTLFNSAAVAYRLGRFTDAAKFARQALELDEQLFGPQHPQVASDLCTLAMSVDTLGHHTEAISHFRRALEILKEAFDANHPHPLKAKSESGIGDALGSLGRSEESLAYHTRAVAGFTRLLGTTDLQTIRSREDHALALGEVGRGAEAVAEARSVVVDATRVLGADHADTAEFTAGLAAVLGAEGRWREALPLFGRALTILRHSSDPTLLGEVLRDHGRALVALDRRPEAIASFEEALGLHERAFGSEHDAVVRDLIELGRAYRLEGRPELARRALERAQVSARHLELPPRDLEHLAAELDQVRSPSIAHHVRRF